MPRPKAKIIKCATDPTDVLEVSHLRAVTTRSVPLTCVFIMEKDAANDEVASAAIHLTRATSRKLRRHLKRLERHLPA